jgi:hypothetical protein
MTALELRAAIDEVLSRVDSLEYALRIEQAACESATKSMHKYAEQAAVLAVQLGNARRIERRDVVMYLRAELGLVQAHGLLLSPERLSQLLDEIEVEKHVRPVHV